MTTPDESEKFDLRSHDSAADKQAALRESFPEVFTEGGKIDFDRLRLVLGDAKLLDEIPAKERYGMNWPGKADCFKTIQQPSMATLVPAPAESWPPAPFTQPRMDANKHESMIAKGEPQNIRVDSRSFAVNTSENLIIEGDNLEVLKLLQKSYLGRVKMIYIDPPYNTGNDFIYPDNYAESLETYLRYTGQVDSEGRKYSTNTEADGRFHSKWLNMMYPRLYLARNLLREDGLIFISIDDHEGDNLRKLCNEIFGEENFVAQLVWNTEGHTGYGTSGVSTSRLFWITSNARSGA
jgi:adenine-specific DNA-methyltransferase